MDAAEQAWWHDRVQMATEGLRDLSVDEAAPLLQARLEALLTGQIDREDR